MEEEERGGREGKEGREEGREKRDGEGEGCARRERREEKTNLHSIKYKDDL